MVLFRALTVTFLASRVAANGTPDNVSSRLQVQIPKSLFKDGGYDHREALFGSPPYGGSISQTVYYTDSDFCDKNAIDPTSGYPRRENNDPWPSPFILMVDRGSCSFVQKARNAQHAGAAGLIIADNLCLCNDQKCLNETGSEDAFVQCENNEPIMADDGSGGDITIPAFLMFKVDANLIKQEVKDRQGIVQLEMSWAMPNPDSKVEYELWTVPSEEVSKDFQKDWKDIAKSLGDHSYFTPHQYIYDGVKSRCHGADGRNLCLNLCTNNGRYCATDPDNDLEHGISGAEVVTEALRRICVWKYYGQDDGVGIAYWDYIFEFLKRCDSDDFFANKDCINDVYKNSKIDGKRIDSCMEDSGGTTADSTNTLLERELDAASRRGVVVLPTMFVNTVALRGSLSTNTVFSAVCAGFHEGTMPGICNKCSGCGDTGECVKKGGKCTTSKAGFAVSGGGVSKKTFGLTLLTMCALFGAAGYFHWRKTREEMRDQVRGILAEYMPLEGGDDLDHNPMDFARKGQTSSLIS
eukprot:CAMPEP_0203641242 /NCGR_PEP_ID=MMETSP0088-20131115/6550_1 /ASSEMBLY_ACC=CAM_ASM_001087 /TAXON_ID=426623 /ORGANISM="Chaetoceros affinis, Strain CCMP159" /LENGTH=522 /DNA_ID=CAMNT_0050496631 /DNA_START=34 /DNA_END=1602 /DNA_ORIENTATION=-